MTDAPPWPPPAVVASGVGSLPGTDPRRAAALVTGELPDLPHVPELPGRGPGAGLTGRGVAVLADLHADFQPAGWRLVDRPGRDVRLARDLLARDLDALEEALDSGGLAPPAVKLAAAGPWTLAASVEFTRGDKLLADAGAVRDLADSLAEGLSRQVAGLRRRVAGARVVVQLDEPLLPAVRAGHVRTASGFGVLRVPEDNELTERLRAVLDGAGADETVVHSCAADPPFDLLRAAGAAALSFDLAVLTRAGDDELAESVEAGLRLYVGVVPSTDPAAEPTATELARQVRALWHRLDQPADRMAGRVVVTPSCGLAGAGPGWARRALVLARDTSRALTEEPE